MNENTEPQKRKAGRPPGAKNKNTKFNYPTIIKGISLESLNTIFKPNAVIPVDFRLIDLLKLPAINLTEVTPEKIDFEVVDFSKQT